VETVDKKTKFFVILPSALIIILLLAATYVPLQSSLSKVHLQVLNFRYKDLKIQRKNVIQKESDMAGPLEFSSPEPVHSLTQETDLAPQTDFNNINVSLIVISGNTKMAIIQGVPVKEGDNIDDKKVLRIESDRVLLKNKTNKWVYVKK
jgi:hypothetical protein